jgi:hypothetical protein
MHLRVIERAQVQGSVRAMPHAGSVPKQVAGY